MVKLNVIGLNSGTSVDGIDVAHITIDSDPSSPDVTISLVSYIEHPIPALLRTRVLSLCRPGAQTSLEEICDLNFELGELFAEAVLSSRVDLNEIDVVASHGQTLWHNPVEVFQGRGYEEGERRMSTLQMAEAAVLSTKTGRTVVNDFRVSELARGRMGAPLAGSFEAGLMRHPTMLRVSQNLGGMGNVTVIPPSSHPLAPGYMAFDTGPGNVLIDASVRILTNGKRQYDKDGVMGKAGAREIDELYVEGFIKSVKYLARSPPKTTGRELFSDDMARRVVDDLRGLGMTGEGIIANVTRITAETVVRALRDFIEPEYGEMEEIYMCGGGAENPNITEFVAKSFPRAKVAKLNEATNPTKNGVNGHSNGMEGVKTRSGIPADAKEAVMFALLGFLCVSGRAVPIASGEKFKEQGVMGKITPGENYGELMRRVMAEEQGGALKRILMK